MFRTHWHINVLTIASCFVISSCETHPQVQLSESDKYEDDMNYNLIKLYSSDVLNDGGRALAISKNGQTLALGSRHGLIRVWDVSKRSIVFRSPTNKSNGAEIMCLNYSPNGRMLASGDRNGGVQIWDISKGSMVSSFQSHPGIVFSLAFSPNGSELATGGEGGKVKLWNTDKWNLVRESVPQSKRVFSVEFSADGTSLAVGEDSEKMELLRSKDLSRLDSLLLSQIKRFEIVVHFLPGDTEMIAFEPNIETRRLFHITKDVSGRLRYAILDKESICAVNGVAPLSDSIVVLGGRWPASSGTKWSYLTLFDFKKKTTVYKFGTEFNFVESVQFDKKSKLIAFANCNGDVYLIEAMKWIP